jgi:hypothetical protein
VRGASSVEEVVDLGVLRESTFPLFREDELAVGEHVVLAPSSIWASCSVSAFNSAARLAARAS